MMNKTRSTAIAEMITSCGCGSQNISLCAPGYWLHIITQQYIATNMFLHNYTGWTNYCALSINIELLCLDAVQQKFTESTVANVKQAIREKCSNAVKGLKQKTVPAENDNE